MGRTSPDGRAPPPSREIRVIEPTRRHYNVSAAHHINTYAHFTLCKLTACAALLQTAWRLQMQLPKGATVAVTDGEKFNLFRNAGDEADLKLISLAHDALIAGGHQGATPGRHGSSANPDGGQDKEDGFSAGVVALLNKKVLAGEISSLLIIAAPRTLGAIRPQYHAKLKAVLIDEISKDLTGHTVQDVEKAIAAAQTDK
jgi:protein required for attachment to host cells